MPRKVRDLVRDLERAGWVATGGGKGSHRKFAHARTNRRVILSGKDNADALHYQEKQVSQALREVKR
jgi:predicted RNA binding protein YcfA (HicA-like mRNA interferase family)